MSTTVALQTTADATDAVAAIVGALPQVVGLAVAAGVAAALLGVLHRWYAGTRVPEGLSVLVGASVVALSIGTLALFQTATIGALPVEPGPILRNVVVFAAAGVSAAAGGRAGDRIGANVFEETPDVTRLVRSVGRGQPLTLPEEIGDMAEYDPVPADLKAELAGRELVFPRGLADEALHDRLVARLKADFGVGHVDVELTDGGAVEYLAVGSRVAGIGPTLSPGTAAVAVTADPAHAASAGDRVQLWADGEHVASGEVRSVAGDTVTLAVEESVAETLPDRRYRLVTLPAAVREDRRFATLLRVADETMDVVTVSEGSPLVGVTVGALALAVVAVRSGGSLDTIPPRSRSLAAGDEVFVVARPEVIRRLQAAADGDGAVPLATGASND